MGAIDRLANKQRLFRRIVLLWACWLITVVALRATEPEVLSSVTTAGGVIVTGVIGILTTVIGFYQWHRQKNERDEAGH